MKIAQLKAALEQRASLHGAGVTEKTFENKRVLVFDIETAPAKLEVFAHSMKRYTNYLSWKDIVEPGYMIAWSAMWLDQPNEVIHRDIHNDDMHSKLWDLLDEASYVIGFNSDRFDLKKVKTFFQKEGFPPFRMPKSIDLIKAARKEFALESFSLGYLTYYFDTEHQKLDEDLGLSKADALWARVVNGDPQARATMRAYNDQDVLATADLYVAMLPWMTNHPTMHWRGVGEDEIRCPRCGSDDYVDAGVSQKIRIRYRQYRCLACSGLFRGALHSRAGSTVAA